MADFETFKDRVRSFGQAERKSVADKRNEQQSTMDKEEGYRQRFEQAARRLFTQFIEPRLRFVADELDGVAYEPVHDVHHGTLDFSQDDRYVATIRLHVGIEPKRPDALEVVSRPEVVPRLINLDTERISFPLESVGEDAAAGFVEGSVGRFLDTFASMRDIPGYRQLGRVRDPVCGMELDRADAAKTRKHFGRTYFFCVEECYQRFIEAPERYALKG